MSCNENINGKEKDSKRVIDSSSHGKDGKSSKSSSKDSSEIISLQRKKSVLM